MSCVFSLCQSARRRIVSLFWCGLVFFGLMSATEVHTADNFSRCLSELQNFSEDKGISREAFDRLTGELTPDMDTVARLDDQPEFTLTFDQYRQRTISAERINRGQQLYQQYRELLHQIESTYGVDPAIMVAIWGIESSYGQHRGSFPILRSLATLSCYGRRQDFFRNEFISALRIVQQGDVTPQNFYGSWAGAFGQTQFLPSSFERSAVDFNKDGRRDIIDSTADALASAANYLKQAGWKTSETWGFAVTTPTGFSAPTEQRHQRRPLSFWVEQGLKRTDGTDLIRPPLTENTETGLLIPVRSSGQAFLVTPNFEALIRYNPSEYYALAVGILADRIRETHE